MSLISFEDLQSDTGAGCFAPVYLVLGPEDYLRREAVRLIRERAVPPACRAFNFDEFSAGETPAAAVLEAARTYPMMARRRLVIVHEVDRAEEADQEEYVTYAQAPEPITVLLLTAYNLDRRTRFFKGLLAHGACLEFPPLQGPALEKWVGEYMRGRGAKVSPKAVRTLVGLAGSDLQTVIMETEKVLAAAGPDMSVTESSLADLVRNDRQRTIFELTDALAAGRAGDALRILANLLEGDEPPLVVLTMLARHFRQVLIVREMLGRGQPPREACRAAQVWKRQDEFVRNAKSIDTVRVEKIYRSLAEVDLRIKSSVDPRMLLEQLICSV
jgi:DNA polymerase III subunit delta